MNLTWELCHSVSSVTTIVASVFIVIGLIGVRVSSKQIKNKERILQNQKDAEYQADSKIKEAKIVSLTKQIEESKTKLSFHSKEITKTDSGYTVKMLFKPSNPNPIGKLGFRAEIEKGSDTKILKFWPLPPFRSGEDSMKISDDGKTARLIYGLFGGDPPKIELQLSGSARVQISGSHELKQFIIDVK